MKIIKGIIFKMLRDSVEWELYTGEIDCVLAILKYKYWDDKIRNLKNSHPTRNRPTI